MIETPTGRGVAVDPPLLPDLSVQWIERTPRYRRYTLWIDGVLRASQALHRPAGGPLARISVGAGLDGADQADAALDELRIIREARVGNSQQTRLIVSQASAGRVDVVDWLGSPMSTLGGFRAPQGLAALADRVLVADPADGSIQVLAFDGTHLAHRDRWTSGPVVPHSLAVAGGGRLLVSDQGDHQVKLLDGDGAVLRRWSGPTDGHAGPFPRPAGLVLLPNGDAVVAIAGNGRVVRSVAPAAARNVYLPLIGTR